jgi:DNA end-binding protein Ku
MVPRANWKGYLKLSLVSCPIAMYPASSEREKIRFHNINSETGNRIRMRRVDEGTGEEVPREKIVRGTKSVKANISKSPVKNSKP